MPTLEKVGKAFSAAMTIKRMRIGVLEGAIYICIDYRDGLVGIVVGHIRLTPEKAHWPYHL